MSQPDTQRNLDDSQTPPDWRRTTASPREDGYGWNPSATSIDRDSYQYPKDCCQSCGTPVDHSVRRVFGDNQDVMHECPRCPTMNREGLTEFANTAGTDRSTKNPEQRRHDK